MKFWDGVQFRESAQDEVVPAFGYEEGQLGTFLGFGGLKNNFVKMILKEFSRWGPNVKNINVEK